jgi:homospermidine synthase
MRHYHPQKMQRILSDEIISGEDELGCLLMGHDFNSWWIGSVLDIETARKLVPNQNATTLQVAAGVVSGIIYMVRHPQEGYCSPENLNHREILEIARPYLGNFISTAVDWSPMTCREDSLCFDRSLPAKEDEWQFSSFLIT